MAKDFKSKSPLTNLAAPATPAEGHKTIDDKATANTEPEIQKTTPAKKRVGRPTTKDVKGTCKNINVAVPIVLLQKWDEVKIVHGCNLTGYITKLIAKDMECNYKKYKAIADNLKNI